ncbi:MAG: DUF1961 family protein [Candidatus Latescibacterota bacterium]
MISFVSLLSLINCSSPQALEPSKGSGAPVAFPGAEGFGAHAEGGRGGDVYRVTNTNDSGAGSLREGIATATGPRTIVFAVSGIIDLQSKLKVDSDYITIAGQTAPGDGICLRNYSLIIQANHVIVRYIRSRLGTDARQESDAISVTDGSNIILDHCSASWSVDETLSAQSGTVDLLTVQWCMVTESLTNSIHKKGRHGYGGIIGALRQSYHHNLFAHHTSRNPKVTSRRHCEVDFRNNVIYNWGFNSHYDGSVSDMNWVSNYMKYGPGTKSGVRDRIFEIDNEDEAPDAALYEAQLYAEGNYLWGYPGVTADNWSGGIDYGPGASEGLNRVHTEFGFPAISQQTAEEAYDLVLPSAGASLARDEIDTRIVAEVIAGTSTFGTNGHIDSPAEVGGWPEYKSSTAPTDTDLDGMPDEWETANGLKSGLASDRNSHDLDAGYTNLEVYLNSIVAPPLSSAETSLVADREAFEKADSNQWKGVFSDACTGDWNQRWFLDGEVGTVRTGPEGMELTSGPEYKNHAHHMVLWTKEVFEGDLKIEYDYTRLDAETRCVNILYIQATGSGEKPYVKDITKWNELRRVPAMRMYFDHMNTYHISYAAFPNDEDSTSYIRARRYMPNKTGLKGSDLEPDYFPRGLFSTGVPHRITVIKTERDIHIRVKNQEEELYCHMTNPDLPPVTEGRIGLRQMFTRSARYRNISISVPQ